jgi:hypothetical protein
LLQTGSNGNTFHRVAQTFSFDATGRWWINNVEPGIGYFISTSDPLPEKFEDTYLSFYEIKAGKMTDWGTEERFGCG